MTPRSAKVAPKIVNGLPQELPFGPPASKEPPEVLLGTSLIDLGRILDTLLMVFGA